jgi:hypothetical protein
MTIANRFQNELRGKLRIMNPTDFGPWLRHLINVGVLMCLTGCITVKRETEPTTTVTTTETRSSTIVPDSSTTVERTVY